MIPRYTPAEFAELWSDRTRYQTWLDVELAACEAMELHGLVPKGIAADIRAMNLTLDSERIQQHERVVRHDVIAFLTHVEELVGEKARWLHRGMTSSDVLDTSLALLLVRATDLLLSRTDELLRALFERASEHRHTVMIGRSHGMHAEPVTFGLVLAGHHAEMRRSRARLAFAREEVAVGKLSGAVGTYAHLLPSLEQEALAQLGLRAETVSTQIVPRDRHAFLFSVLGLVASSVERLATNVRHWQRTEVSEAEERFGAGQKGSSAMPHKRNPILSENLCGLARVVRSAVTPALEDVVLWHERDISHSSVERMIAPDATTTLGFMLERTAQLVRGLVVFPGQMEENLKASGGLIFSESVLLALVDKGLFRQQAYALVQRNAMRAMDGTGTFRTNLEQDPEIAGVLGASELSQCFELEHALRHVDAIFERAFETEASPRPLPRPLSSQRSR